MSNKWGLPDEGVTTPEESQAYFDKIRDFGITVQGQVNISGALPAVYNVHWPIVGDPDAFYPSVAFVLGFDSFTGKWVNPDAQYVKASPTPDEVIPYLKEPHTVEEIYKFLGV